MDEHPMGLGEGVEIPIVTSCYIKLAERKGPDELLCSKAILVN